MVLGGHRFVGRDECEAAQRDYAKIQEIRKKIDFNHKESVSRLYGDLQTGAISFETVLGQDFDDEVYEAYTKYEQACDISNQVSRTSVGKKAKTSGTKTNAESKGKKRISLDDFDKDMQEQILLELQKKERRRRGILLVCALVAVGCLVYFGIYEYMTIRTERDAQKLSSAIKDEPQIFTPENVDDKYYAQLTDPENGTPIVLKKYEDLYNQNKSLIGWVKIADTIIDYPVMQSVDNEYYLDHNFHQEYDKNGSIFLDAACSIYPRSTNLIIYGHHMKSGSMFGSLQSYQSESYYQNHRYIEFDSIYEEGTYEVMFAFRDRVYSREDVNFKYYEFIDANSEEEFNSYMNEMAAVSYYDTGVTAVYGDHLLTLSTCDYQQDNGRFVVVARRVYE